MLHCFVEGPDDETFFSNIFCNIEVSFHMYANKPPLKINQFLRTLNQMNESYLFFADGDGDTYQNKQQKILNKYYEVNSNNLFIVQYEIESWFLAGVDKSFCDKNKFKTYYQNTDNVTKEMFNDIIKNCKATRLNVMLNILSVYDCVLADAQNKSFNTFFIKNASICI